MKTVSGGLKTDLAQFRELQAFATFGSELDRVSRAQLDRGVRLTELLKQPQSSPVPVEEQVVAIYAGTKGFLDDLAVDDVRAFETALVQNFRANHSDLLESIRTTKALPPTDQLDKAIAEVKKGFASTKPETASAGPAEAAAGNGPAGATTSDEPAPAAVTAGAGPEGEA